MLTAYLDRKLKGIVDGDGDGIRGVETKHLLSAKLEILVTPAAVTGYGMISVHTATNVALVDRECRSVWLLTRHCVIKELKTLFVFGTGDKGVVGNNRR